MDDQWYLDQIKIVDAFMQEGNGVPPEVLHAYHHGVRGWMSTLSGRLILADSIKKCPVCECKVPATFECGDCGWIDDGTEYSDKRCGCGYLLIHWENAGTFLCSCGKEHEGSYYCKRCDNEQLHNCDGTVGVIS